MTHPQTTREGDLRKPSYGNLTLYLLVLLKHSAGINCNSSTMKSRATALRQSVHLSLYTGKPERVNSTIYRESHQ